MNSRHPIRGVVYSIAESGIARLVIDNDFNHFHGCLLNDQEESIAIDGTSIVCPTPPELIPVDQEYNDAKDGLLHKDTTSPVLHKTMRISVIDGETGDKFMVENVPVKLTPKRQEATNVEQYWIEITHPAIKFSTEEILVGNRADVEIQRHLDPPGRLARSNSRSANNKHVSGDHRNLHVGPMVLRIAAVRKIEPSERRISTTDVYETVVTEEARGFLV